MIVARMLTTPLAGLTAVRTSLTLCAIIIAGS